MITYTMVKQAADGLSNSLVDTEKTQRRKCPNLQQILHTISLVLGLLQQITQQVQELEKFKESYEAQKRFVENQK